MNNKEERLDIYGWILVSVLVLWLIFHMFGLRIGVVYGMSMCPTLRNGDLIIISKIDKSSILTSHRLEPGDIVCAWVCEYPFVVLNSDSDEDIVGGMRTDKVTVWRVVKRIVCILIPKPSIMKESWEDDMHSSFPLFVLCGDNREDTGKYIVSLSQIEGKVVAIIPQGGSVLLALLLVGIAGLLGLSTYKLIAKRRGGANATSA